MVKYLKVDLEDCYGISLCDTKEELIKSCGYNVNETTFEELLLLVEGVCEIVELKGEVEIKWLVELA